MPPSSSETALVLTTNNAQAEILLIDGRFRVLARGISPLQWCVMPGLYLIKVKVGDEEVERVFTVPPDIPTLSQHLDAPLFESPIPLRETSTTHEYHVNYVRELTGGSFPAISCGAGSEILVSLRDSSKTPDRVMQNRVSEDDLKRYRESFHGLSLVDSDGNPLVDLSSKAKIDLAAGYLAARVEVAPGAYALAHERLGLRLCISLPAAAGWSHQVFVRLSAPAQAPFDAVPDLLDASVLIDQPGAVFDTDRYDVHLVETVRRGFVDGRNYLGSEARTAIARGIDNPMLGMYGAHLLLREAEFDAATFDGAVDRLVQQLGPKFPDVLALRWARARKSADGAAMAGCRADLPEIAGPPLLTLSWNLLVELAQIVELGSTGKPPALRVAPNLLAGSVFVNWRQVEPAPRRDATRRDGAPGTSVFDMHSVDLTQDVAAERASVSAGKRTWVDMAKAAAGTIRGAIRGYGSVMRARNKPANDAGPDLADTINAIGNVNQAAAALRTLAQSYSWNLLVANLRKEYKWTQYLTGLQRDLISILSDAAGEAEALDGVTPLFVQRLLDTHRIPLSTLVQALSDLELGGWLQVHAVDAELEAVHQHETTKALRDDTAALAPLIETSRVKPKSVAGEPIQEVPIEDVGIDVGDLSSLEEIDGGERLATMRTKVVVEDTVESRRIGWSAEEVEDDLLGATGTLEDQAGGLRGVDDGTMANVDLSGAGGELATVETATRLTAARSVDFSIGEEAATMSEVGSKLDLARAYIDMGDPEGARSILDEILNAVKDGDSEEREAARQMIASLR